MLWCFGIWARGLAIVSDPEMNGPGRGDRMKPGLGDRVELAPRLERSAGVTVIASVVCNVAAFAMRASR